MKGYKLFTLWVLIATPVIFTADLFINDRQNEFSKKVEKVLISGDVQRKEVKIDEMGDKRYYVYLKDEPFLVKNDLYNNYPVGSKLTLVTYHNETTNKALSNFYCTMILMLFFGFIGAVIYFIAFT